MPAKKSLVLVALIAIGIALSLWAWLGNIELALAHRGAWRHNALLAFGAQCIGAALLLRMHERAWLIYAGLGGLSASGIVYGSIVGKPIGGFQYLFCAVALATAVYAWTLRDSMQ